MHIVITGASSGIGEAIARKYAAEGHNLTLIARRKAKLEALAADLSVEVHIAAQDLSDPGQVTSWIAGAVDALGPIDVMVNNAGVQFVEPTHTMSCDDGELCLQVNLMAPLRIIRHVIDQMLERGSGTIVNIASMAALAPTAAMTYYNASKAGIAAASEAMRGELRDKGINVLTVYPGIISTPMGDAGYEKFVETKSLRHQPKGTTEGLADRVYRAVERGKARVVYPRVYGISRWMPPLTRFIMDRFTPRLKDEADQTV